MEHFCKKCPDRPGCVAICERLRKELPNDFTGRGPERFPPARYTGADAVIILNRDGMPVEEIAYHVHLSINHIKEIIQKDKLGQDITKKLGLRE